MKSYFLFLYFNLIIFVSCKSTILPYKSIMKTNHLLSTNHLLKLENNILDSSYVAKDTNHKFISIIANNPNNNNNNITSINSAFIDFFLNENVKLCFYLIVWYIGNIYYNLYNKRASIALGKDSYGHSNAHWILSATQLFVGLLFVIPQWLFGIRTIPSLTSENWIELAPVGKNFIIIFNLFPHIYLLGLFTALSHALSVLAMGAGAVSFGQIVKSAEPVFAAATNAAILKVYILL